MKFAEARDVGGTYFESVYPLMRPVQMWFVLSCSRWGYGDLGKVASEGRAWWVAGGSRTWLLCVTSSPLPPSLPLSEQHGTTHTEQQGLALRPEWGAARGRHPGSRLGHRYTWLGLRL